MNINTMKSIKNLILLNCIIAAFILTSCNSYKNKIVLKSFSIEIIKTQEDIELLCTEGCAWTQLKFTNNNYQPQYVDELGMSNKSNEQTKKTDAKLANFLFSISKTDKGIQLNGIEGTAWKELNFSLKNNATQIINQMGMKK